MYGITLASWQSYVGYPVTIAELQALTPADIETFYKALYWDKVDGDGLQSGLDLAVFDCAVNSGPHRAVVLLQGACGATQDGILGPQTIMLANAMAPTVIIPDFCEARLAFLKSLSTWEDNPGWATRVAHIQATALSWSTGRQESA